MAIYKEFQEIFDGFMEEFCEAEGVDSTEFMQKMQESAEDDPRAAHYIRCNVTSVTLLCYQEYKPCSSL